MIKIRIITFVFLIASALYSAGFDIINAADSAGAGLSLKITDNHRNNLHGTVERQFSPSKKSASGTDSIMVFNDLIVLSITNLDVPDASTQAILRNNKIRYRKTEAHHNATNQYELDSIIKGTTDICKLKNHFYIYDTDISISDNLTPQQFDSIVDACFPTPPIISVQ